MAVTAEYYPPVSFHFRVEFQGIAGNGSNDTLFQEVSGLTMELEKETINEGGENRFSHKLPVRASYPNLVLKRGLLTDSAVIAWVRDAIENLDIQPITVLVTLLNERHEPLQTYQCVNAWPQKWSINNFNSQENQLAIETMELVYQYFKIL